MWKDVEDLLCKLDKTDEDIERVLPWFYENVKCFKQVKEETVKEVIRKSEYAPVRKDHVIIRQGEVGDCCYIILRGTVTVFTRRTDEIDNLFQDEPSPRTTVKSYKDRSKLGIEVSVLKSGDKFGDLCFFKSNCERNATVIADDNLDLLVVDKEVYRINLPEKFDDTKDELQFMETSRLFKGFPYDYRITLLEKMKPRRVHYGSEIVHQGDPVTSIFLICRGEALLKINPTKLNSQYQLESKNGSSASPSRPLTVIQRRREILKHGYTAGEKLLKRQNVTVATLGPNELIGDVEFMLNLATHHVTAVCNSSMLVMEMEITELHRLLLKRDLGVSEHIQATVLCKLNARANRCTDIPQYRDFYEIGLKALKLREEATQGKTRMEESRKSTLVTVANAIRLGARLGGMVKANQTAAAKDEQSDSISKALKKTATIAVEIGGGNKIANKFLELVKRHPEGVVETTGQDDVPVTRATKGKSRKEGQLQDKGKKQFTVKEYRALKKKMQAAGKTIPPSD